MPQHGLVRVNNWTAVITLMSLIVAGIIGFANLQTNTEELRRRIERLENQANVSMREYQEGQRVIEQRLDRIERKIDNAADVAGKHRY